MDASRQPERTPTGRTPSVPQFDNSLPGRNAPATHFSWLSSRASFSSPIPGLQNLEKLHPLLAFEFGPKRLDEADYSGLEKRVVG